MQFIFFLLATLCFSYPLDNIPHLRDIFPATSTTTISPGMSVTPGFILSSDILDSSEELESVEPTPQKNQVFILSSMQDFSEEMERITRNSEPYSPCDYRICL